MDSSLCSSSIVKRNALISFRAKGPLSQVCRSMMLGGSVAIFKRTSAQNCPKTAESVLSLMDNLYYFQIRPSMTLYAFNQAVSFTVGNKITSSAFLSFRSKNNSTQRRSCSGQIPARWPMPKSNSPFQNLRWKR